MWWWIIRIILKSGVFPLKMESAGKTTRRRPLQICGASILAIAHIVCTKAQDFDSPIGSMVKRITPLINSALPLIYAMQYQWLVTLSFIDDRILDIENIVEFIFPPSKRLFNKIDDLVYTAESLPEKFDHVLNSFPVLIHRFPLLDRVLLRIISWLTHLGSKDNSSSTREKEIKIDMNYSKSESGECNPVDNSQEPSNALQTEQVKRSEHWNKTVEEAYCTDEESPCAASFESATSSPVSVLTQDETKTAGEKGMSDNLKCSYKEILERGTIENAENEVTDALEEYGWEKDGKKSKEGSILKDQIIELFEASRPLN